MHYFSYQIGLLIMFFHVEGTETSYSFSKYIGILDLLRVGQHRGKYRGWNGSTVEISCWANLARPSAGIKNSPNNLCSHVIFIVFFEF